MSNVQTNGDHEDHRHPTTDADAEPERVLAYPLKVKLADWCRQDWPTPVGSFSTLHGNDVASHVGEFVVKWRRFEIPEFWLTQLAALLLLQGMSLSQLLIPGNFLRTETPNNQGTQVHGPLAHLLLRVDPWEAWQPLPRLTNLVLARLDEIPQELEPQQVLAALARDSSST